MPFVEFDADPLLDPGKGVLLAEQNTSSQGKNTIAQRTGRFDVAVLDVVFQFLEPHADQPAALDDEGLGAWLMTISTFSASASSSSHSEA